MTQSGSRRDRPSFEFPVASNHLTHNLVSASSISLFAPPPRLLQAR